MDSRFVNNRASLLGGSVFVDMQGEMAVGRAYFENTPHSSGNSLQGDIVYSDGKMNINEVSLGRILNKIAI